MNTRDTLNQELEELEDTMSDEYGIWTIAAEEAVKAAILRVVEAALQEMKYGEKIEKYPDGSELWTTVCAASKERADAILLSLSNDKEGEGK